MKIGENQTERTLNILYVWDKMYLEKKKSYCVSKQGAMRVTNQIEYQRCFNI